MLPPPPWLKNIDFKTPFTLYRYSFDPSHLSNGSSAFTLERTVKTVPFTHPDYTVTVRLCFFELSMRISMK